MGVFVFILVAIFFVFMFFFCLVNIGEYGVGSVFWLCVSGFAIYHIVKLVANGSKTSTSSASNSPQNNSIARRPSSGSGSSNSADTLKYVIYADLADRITSNALDVDEDDNDDRDKDDLDDDDDYLYLYDDKDDY